MPSDPSLDCRTPPTPPAPPSITSISEEGNTSEASSDRPSPNSLTVKNIPLKWGRRPSNRKRSPNVVQRKIADGLTAPILKVELLNYKMHLEHIIVFATGECHTQLGSELHTSRSGNRIHIFNTLVFIKTNLTHK